MGQISAEGKRMARDCYMKRCVVTYNPNGTIADIVEIEEARTPVRHPPRLWAMLRLLFDRKAYVMLMWSAMYALRFQESVRGTGSTDVLIFRHQDFYKKWVDKTGEM